MGEDHTLISRLRKGRAHATLAALVAAMVAYGVGPGLARLALWAVAAGLVVTVPLLGIAAWWLDRRIKTRLRTVLDFLEYDSAPGFCTDADGAVFAQNRAAIDRFGNQDGRTMSRALERLFANPDAVVHRLALAAQGGVTAREDVITRSGHLRVAVHRMPGGQLWRLEDLVDRPPRAADGIGLPILTFGPSGTILFMNEVMRARLGTRVKRLREVFAHLPLKSGGLNRLLGVEGEADVRVILSEPVNGRQEVFVMPAMGMEDGQVALDALPVALVRLDATARILSANRAALELLPTVETGQSPHLGELVEGLGRSVREWVAEASAGRGLYRPETVRITSAEADRFLQITLGRPLDGQDGLIAVLNDATELKTMEAQFVQSQKMQAIGQLAGGVAHDFNNLLTAISGHCDLLMLRHQEHDEDYADLVQINQNASRAAALVGQLLAFSRKQTLQMRPVDLRDTLGDLTHLLDRLVGERVRLVLRHDPALVPIRGDRRQLEQVLMNLVVNARDAMPQGGTVRIETAYRYLEAPMSRDRVTVPPGQYVVVTVTDEGDGIAPDKLPRIFEPFFTTKRPGEGTGLGLSMAYGIVKQSGGYIFADSAPGEGACFSLFFPVSAEAVATPLLDDAADDIEAVTASDAGRHEPDIVASIHDPILTADPSIAAASPGPDASPQPCAKATPPRAGAMAAGSGAMKASGADGVTRAATPCVDDRAADDRVRIAFPTEPSFGPGSDSPTADVGERDAAQVSASPSPAGQAPASPPLILQGTRPMPDGTDGDPTDEDGVPPDVAILTDLAGGATRDAAPGDMPSSPGHEPEPEQGDTIAAVQRALHGTPDGVADGDEADEAQVTDENVDDIADDRDDAGVSASDQSKCPGPAGLRDHRDPADLGHLGDGPKDRDVEATVADASLPKGDPSSALEDATPGGAGAPVPAAIGQERAHDAVPAGLPGDGSAWQADDAEAAITRLPSDAAVVAPAIASSNEGTAVPGPTASPAMIAMGGADRTPGDRQVPVSAHPVGEALISAVDAEPSDADGNARRVLLVEDEAPVRAFASRALKLRGWEVLEAANAEDALELLEDEGLRVDLFLTDVMMPGQDGPTWVRQALQARPGVHTIFVSGYTQDALSEDRSPVPNSTFLPKPFSLAELTQTVERALA